MRILHVIPSVASCRGGPSEAVLAMVRSQIQLGLDSRIATTNDAGVDVLDVPLNAFVEHREVPVLFFPRWSPPVASLREFQHGIGFSSWLKGQMKHFDCFHVHGLFSSLSTCAMQLARSTGMPYLARPLGQLHPWSLKQSALKKQVYWALAERSNISGAAAVHCTSVQESEHVTKLISSARTLVVPHGVEPQPPIENAGTRLRQHLGIAAATPVILFLSRWHTKKNIPLLLEALSAIRSEPWILVLAGSSEDHALTASIHRRCAELDLLKRVIFPGHVSGEKKSLLLQGSDLFVLPSASENFGIAVAEALVHGTPVVTTPEVDIAYVVRQLNGGLIADAAPQPWTEALLTMLKQLGLTTQKERTRLAQAARNEFSWRSNAQELSRAYSTLKGVSS